MIRIILKRDGISRALRALIPSYSRAYSGLAVTWQMEAISFSNVDRSRDCYDRSMEFAEKALKLDETDYQAHISIAWVLLYGGEYERIEKAHRQSAHAESKRRRYIGGSSYILALYGDAESAIANAEAAARLNPRHPDWYSPLPLSGFVYSAPLRGSIRPEVSCPTSSLTQLSSAPRCWRNSVVWTKRGNGANGRWLGFCSAREA